MREIIGNCLMFGSAFTQLFVLDPIAQKADQYRFEHLEENANIIRDILTAIPVETAKAINGFELHPYFADGWTESVHFVPEDNTMWIWIARGVVGALFALGAVLVTASKLNVRISKKGAD